MIKRTKGACIAIPFVYGTTAVPLTMDDARSDPSHTHRWSVYVKGVDGQDLSVYIKKVAFKLHDSFATPTRVLDSPPYNVTETG